MKETMRNQKPLIAALALACAVLLFADGCATTAGSSSAASMKIAESERSIDAARHDCVQNPSDLRNAELKLTQARAAKEAQDYVTAAWRAEEAAADADYARTKAALDQAEQYAEQLQKSNTRLKTGLGNPQSY